MKNLEIRELADKKRVKLWEIAEKLGLADSNFSRKLRKELCQEEKTKIFTIINELAK